MNDDAIEVNDDAIEAAAIEIWRRMAPRSSLEWSGEPHRAEYLDCARAALAAAESKAWCADIVKAPANARLLLAHPGGALQVAWVRDREVRLPYGFTAPLTNYTAWRRAPALPENPDAR